MAGGREVGACDRGKENTANAVEPRQQPMFPARCCEALRFLELTIDPRFTRGVETGSDYLSTSLVVRYPTLYRTSSGELFP